MERDMIWGVPYLWSTSESSPPSYTTLYLLYHDIYEKIVHKHVTIEYSVSSPVLNLKLLLCLYTWYIVTYCPFILQRVYLKYVCLWDLNLIQPELLVPNIKSYSKFCQLKCKRVLFISSWCILKKFLSHSCRTVLHIVNILPRSKSNW